MVIILLNLKDERQTVLKSMIGNSFFLIKVHFDLTLWPTDDF